MVVEAVQDGGGHKQLGQALPPRAVPPCANGGELAAGLSERLEAVHPPSPCGDDGDDASQHVPHGLCQADFAGLRGVNARGHLPQGGPAYIMESGLHVLGLAHVQDFTLQRAAHEPDMDAKRQVRAVLDLVQTAVLLQLDGT